MEDPNVVQARQNNWREPGQTSPIPTVYVWPPDEKRGERIKRILRADPRSRGQFVEFSDKCMPALPENEVPLPKDTIWLIQASGRAPSPNFDSNYPQQGTAAATQAAAASSSSSGLRRGDPPPPPSPRTGSGSERPIPPPPPTRTRTQESTEDD